MNDIIKFLTENYEWLFSGIGVTVISFFIFKRIASTNNVKQKDIFAGGDVVGRDKN